MAEFKFDQLSTITVEGKPMEPQKLWIDVDWSQVQWGDLISFSDFEWKMGSTPFSHFQIPVFLAVFYLLSIYLMQAWMKERKAYVLKIPSFVHNVFLSILSFSMFLGSCYGAYLKYKQQGLWAGLVCEQEQEPMKGTLFYWCYIFYLSKFYEFIDSYLLVLKKKPLIFLHVFHHFVMPFVCWAGLQGKWCMALWTSSFWNSFVHIFMYYYYAVSTIGISPWWKKYLTGLQIYQFVTGVFYTSIYFYYYFGGLQIRSTGLSYKQGCTGDFRAILFMFSVNCSFLFLFVKFYMDTYNIPRHSSRHHQSPSSTPSLGHQTHDPPLAKKNA